MSEMSREDIARLAIALRSEGYNKKQIADWFNTQGIPKVINNKSWDNNRVQAVISHYERHNVNDSDLLSGDEVKRLDRGRVSKDIDAPLDRGKEFPMDLHTPEERINRLFFEVIKRVWNDTFTDAGPNAGGNQAAQGHLKYLGKESVRLEAWRWLTAEYFEQDREAICIMADESPENLRTLALKKEREYRKLLNEDRRKSIAAESEAVLKNTHYTEKKLDQKFHELAELEAMVATA